MSVFSVIMPSASVGPLLLASIKSALKQDRLKEVLLVDTGTPLDMLARLQQMALTEPRLRIIAAGDMTVAKAFNAGAAEASGEILAFLRPDCLLPPHALAAMQDALQASDNHILAGCRVLAPNNNVLSTPRVHPLTPEAHFVETLCLSAASASIPANVKLCKVETVPAAFFCIAKADFETLGGMDEAFTYGAHLDLCKRIRAAGGDIAHVTAIEVTCMADDRHASLPGKKEWEKKSGIMRYFRKHFADDSVPGFLMLLNFAMTLRFVYRMARQKIRALLTPELLMSHSVAAKRLMVLASGLYELPEKQDWYGRTVLVTGATSQVGLCVVRRLISQGAAVLALSRDDAIPYQHEHLRWLKGDLMDAELDLQGYLVDVAVHCAPLWTLPPAIEKLANAEVKRLIAFGTTSIFGKALSQNAHEKDMVKKLVQAEQLIAEACKEKQMDYTILRPTLTYGVGLDLNITSIAKCIDRYGFFPVYPPAFGRRQPVHADDLAMAVIQAADSTATHGKSYNLSGSEVLTYHQMLERIFAVCGKPVKIVKTTLLPFLLGLSGFMTRKKHLNGEVARRMNDDLIFFHDDATRDFAFHPRPFLSGGMKDIEGF